MNINKYRENDLINNFLNSNYKNFKDNIDKIKVYVTTHKKNSNQRLLKPKFEYYFCLKDNRTLEPINKYVFDYFKNKYIVDYSSLIFNFIDVKKELIDSYKKNLLYLNENEEIKLNQLELLYKKDFDGLISNIKQNGLKIEKRF